MNPKTQNEKRIFCLNVKKLRMAYGLSKKERAKILHIGVASLTKMENGILPPRASYLIVIYICESFHVAPSQIFSEEFEPKPLENKSIKLPD